MKKINLSITDFSLLKRIDTDDHLSVLNPCLQGEKMVLEGTRNQFETVVNQISDELSNHGFNDSFEPTEYGRALERLIDIFSFIYE